MPERTDDAISCADLHTASSIALSYATTALVESYGEEYVAYYTGLSEAYRVAGDACDAAASGP